jgi:CheY-like chemotaxis protein
MSARKRILIIDDEADFGRLIGEVAADLGYETVVMSTPDAFQTAYRATPPDVIALDIVMPKMDGIEIIRWLVNQNCRARILIISGYNPLFSKAAQMIGEQEGKLDIRQLRKPVKLAELRAALTEALGEATGL